MNHYVFAIQTSSLTISFDNTVAVVADISKQLSATRGEKQRVSNTIIQHNAALALLNHGSYNMLRSKNMQTGTGYRGIL